MVRKIVIPNLSALPRKTKKKMKNELERMLKREVMNQLQDFRIEEESENSALAGSALNETLSEPVALPADSYVTRSEFDKIAAQRDEFINDFKAVAS